MSPRNEVVKKKNYPFKQTTLSDECIGFCLQMTINMHLFLAWSLQMGHKMSNESTISRMTPAIAIPSLQRVGKQR